MAMGRTKDLLLLRLNRNIDEIGLVKASRSAADRDFYMSINMKMLSKVTGRGRPIVLVPGGLTGWISWDKHEEILSSERKVVRVQLLNVQLGLENTSLPSDYSIKTESHALASSLEDLNLEKPFDMVAWSYGAFVALDYALDNPLNIRTLTLIEPPAFWVLRSMGPLDSKTNGNVKMLESLHGDITEDMLEQFLVLAGFVPPGATARQLPQWESWINYRQSLRNSPAVIQHTDDTKRLKTFDKPVFLLKGTDSAIFLHQIIDVLSGYFPNAKISEMPAGHAPHIVSMDRFLKELKEFQSI